MNTVLQNPESVGTIFKTLSARVRSAKTELEELGEEEDEFTQSTSKLRDLIKGLTGFDILESDEQTFKSIYDILVGIGEKWDDLTDVEQASLGEALAGKRNANALYAILNNLDTLESAYETATNSAGSAMREQQNFEQGLEYSTNRLKASLEELAADTLNSDFLKGAIDATNTLVQLFDKLITESGTVTALFTTLGAVFGGKIGLFSGSTEGLLFGGKTLGENSDNKQYRKQLGVLSEYLGKHQDNKKLSDFSEDLWSGWLGGIDKVDKRTKELFETYQKGGLTAKEAVAKIQTELSTVGKSTGKLTATIKGLFSSLRAGLINGIISFGISKVLEGAITGIKYLYDEVFTNTGEIERRLESVKNLSQSIADNQKEIQSIEDTISEYDELSKKLKNTSLSTSELLEVKESLLGIQDTLIESYGNEVNGIDLVNGSYEEQLALLQQIKKEKAEEFLFTGEDAAFAVDNHGKTNFEKNLDILEDKVKSSYYEDIGSYNILDDLEWAKAFNGISFNKRLSQTGVGEEVSFLSLTIDPDLTKEEANEVLNDFYAELNRQYPDNQEVQAWLKNSKKAFGLDDYTASDYATARANIEHTIKQLLVDASDDGSTIFDEINSAVKAYNKALTEVESNTNEQTQNQYEQAKAHLDEVKKMAENVPDAISKYSEGRGVDDYQKMVSDAFDKVQLTTDEKIEQFFDNVTDKTSGSFEEFKKEYQKIFDWGLGSYQKDITNPVSTKFGNIDMDNRQLIQYDEEYLAKHKEALESWFDYDEAGNIVGTYYDYLAEAIKNGEEVIDTVFGTSSSFRWGNQEHEIAFSPILQTENGPVFLSEQNCEDYISSVIDKAAEDGIITADEIIKIDAEGTGFQVGDQFVKGLIAGVDTTGNQKGIHASIIGSLMHFIGDYGALSIAAKGKPKSNIKEYTQEQRTRLTDEERKIFDQSLLSSNAKILTLQDIDGLIKEAKEKAAQADIEMEVKVKASDAVDSMADAKTALNSLEALYDQVVNKTEKEGQATGFADPALINSVESAFSKFVTDDEAGQKLNAALENFEKTLVEFPDKSDKAQDAMDELITAYIDQTDIIKNLTEENAEWSKAQLTAMGITNAEEVVMTRLNKTSKKLSEGLSKVTETLKANADALQESKQGTTEYEEAIKQLANDVAEMLSFQSEDGTISFDASTVVDSSFIEAHRADIDAMVEGDIDALNRVRAAAAKAAVMTVMVDMPTEAAEQQVNHIMDMVAQADAMNIDVGASIDDSAFLQALSNMVGQSQTMANAVSKAFETMGYNVKFIPNKYKMRVPSGGNVTTVYGGPDAGQAIHWTEAELDIPSVQITRAGTAGAKATYTPPANTPSGGGGGGGGGDNNSAEPNKPKEEAEETFDWIEVKLQRLQEAEERLSKVVSNTYDLWSKRNKSLEGEIDNVTEQIKAEEKAQDHYLKYADSIQVNGGKGLNDDDYGENDAEVKANDQRLLEEAIQQFDAYKQKVREGLIGEKDIETIQNHFLAEAISNYKTWYEKSVQAGDAVQDLKIKLGDLAKTRFDNVKSEFDGLIGIIDAKADIIEKRIDKAQARGFFTDEKYYKQLIAYNDQEYAKVLAEYKGLVAARDKALAEGSIAKNSEEWVAMSTDILNAKGRLDELTTSTINYRKELNQIKWDKFEFLNENLQRVNTEMADLIELMGNHELVDEKGIFNEYGQATLAMYLGQYNALANEQKVLQEQYEEAQKDLKDDPLNKEKIENLQRLEDALRENAKERINIEKSVTDEFKNAIDTRLNYLNELIDKYNEALDSEKDLYSYQKNIQKQVENISHLERMLNAYEGDDSEEARKIRQVTGAQLEEARQQLEETEWDRMISETKKSLSDLSEDYNEYLNEAIKKWENVFKAGMQVVNGNMESIRTTIENTAKDNFFSLSDELQYALDTSTSRTDEDYYGVAMDIIKNGNNSSWGNSSANQNKHLEDRGFDSARIREIIAELQSGHKYAGGSIDSNEMQSVFAGIAYEILKTGKDSAWGSSRKEQVANWTKLWGSDIANNISAMADSMNAAHKNGVSWATLAEANGFDTDYTKYQKKLYGEAWDNLLGAYGISANDLSKYQKTQYSTGYASPASGYSQAFITTQTKAYNNVGTIASTLDIIKQYVSDLSDNQKAEQQKDDEETDNKTDGKHYAKGTHHVTRDEIAITQENGTEIMFRASDGSMLTPLGAGDMVFTNEMSQRLWDIAKNGLPTGINATVPQVASNVGNTINQDNAISITLPNVTNYDEFKAALKKDTQFTNFVQEITVGQLAGNNTLKKNRY